MVSFLEGDAASLRLSLPFDELSNDDRLGEECFPDDRVGDDAVDLRLGESDARDFKQVIVVDTTDPVDLRTGDN